MRTDQFFQKTYDVHFNNGENCNNKGFKATLEYCHEYILMNNGTDLSYFKDYKGGIVQIHCNETDEIVFGVEIE